MTTKFGLDGAEWESGAKVQSLVKGLSLMPFANSTVSSKVRVGFRGQIVARILAE